MVDPYGVRGVHLDLLDRLLKLKRLEVLLTFMARDMSRFLASPNYAEALTRFFGGEQWRACERAEDRPECLFLTFQDVVVPDTALHALPFRVFEDAKKTVLYYLVHMTNSDLGMRKMKEAMVKEHGEMIFWPATLRDPNQMAFDVAEEKPFPSLQDHLADAYQGRTLTFEELLNADYKNGAWLEPHYRWAVDEMDKGKPQRATITRNRTTKSSRPARGLQLPDAIEFS